MSPLKNIFKGFLYLIVGTLLVLSFHPLCAAQDTEKMSDREKKAIMLNTEAVKLTQMNRFSEAEEKLKEALKLSTDLVHIATFHSNLGYIYYNQRRLEESLAEYRLALKMTEKDNEKKAYLEFICSILIKLRRWEEAKTAHEELLPFQAEPEEKARTLSDIGNILQELGEFDQARNRFMEALQMVPDPQMRTLIFMELGETANQQGDLEESLEFYEEARRMLKDSDDKAIVLNTMATVLVSHGRFDEAEEKIRYSLSLARSPETQMLALNNLGVVLRYKGKLSEVQHNFERALQLTHDFETKGKILNNLGDLFRLQGKWSKAEEMFLLALDQFQRDEDIGTTYVNLSLLFYERGQYEEALRYAARGVYLVSEPETLAVALNNLGLVFSKLEETEEAKAKYERALKLTRNPDLKGTILNNMGSLLRQQGKLQEAQAEFGEAIMLKQNPESKAWSMGNLGDIFCKSGQLDKAMNTLQEGLQLVARSMPSADKKDPYPNPAFEQVKFPLVAANILCVKGEVLELMASRLTGKDKMVAYLEKARETLNLAIELIDKLRMSLVEPETKIDFMFEMDRVYEFAIRVSLKLHKLTGLKQYAQDAFYLSERARSRAFLEQLHEARAKVNAGIDRDILDKEQELKVQMALLEKTLIQEEDKTGGGDLVKVVSLRKRKENLEREYRKFLQDLEEQYPRYAALKYPRVLNAGEVRKNVLRKGEVLAEYFVGENETYLFLMDKDRFYDPVIIPLTSSQVREEVAGLREPLYSALMQGRVDLLNRFSLQQAHALYEKLLGEAEKTLEKANTVIIIPHGPLYYLPFEMLVYRQGKGETDPDVWLSGYEDSEYVIDHFPPIAYAPSASLMNPQTLRKDTSGVQYKGKLLAFAHGLSTRLVQASDGSTQKFVSLPYSRAEVERVAALFLPRVRVYIGEEGRTAATEEAAKTEIPYYNYLLFSLHGTFDDRNPFYSALVFPAMAKQEDGLLETFEVFNQSINAELVVLSACESGLGMLRGGEGIVGMTRAFMYAGSPSVLASLWMVYDRSTSELMAEFYRNFTTEGFSKAEALRLSKLKLKGQREEREEDKISYSHPFFWAPFVLQGEWR